MPNDKDPQLEAFIKEAERIVYGRQEAADPLAVHTLLLGRIYHVVQDLGLSVQNLISVVSESEKKSTRKVVLATAEKGGPWAIVVGLVAYLLQKGI